SDAPADRQAKARPSQRVARDQELQAPSPDPEGIPPDPLEVGLGSNASRARPAFRTAVLLVRANKPPQQSSNREALAALLPAPAEDGAATPRAHPHPEPVGPLPPAVIGLKCPLHGSSLPSPADPC